MKHTNQKYFFLAQAYGACNYGQNSYQENTCQSATPSTKSGQNGGVLVNTGLAVDIILVIASVIILTSLFVRFWRRNRNTKNSQK